MTDVLIIGAGHNALVAAAQLSRNGRKVHVLERASMIGGAAKTEAPFPKAPGMRHSTGAYLLGLMPPEIMNALDINIPTIRRDPHYFLPQQSDGYLLFGSDQTALQSQFESFFSPQDWKAHQALQKEISALREDVGHTWLSVPMSIEETAERFVRPALKEVFVALCRGSVGNYLDRFDFKSDLVKAMYAVTDGFSGLCGTWDTPGTGMNFLIHNMCRLPNSDGTWMVVKGGMGTVSQTIAEAARKAGAIIETDAEVTRIDVESGVARGVTLSDGRSLRAEVVVAGCDPFRTINLLGDNAPKPLSKRVDNFAMSGMTLKLNLCLSDLPTFTCLPEDKGQHRGTIHLLPSEADVMESLSTSFQQVQNGELAEFPTIEWYIHTTIDPSLSDTQGNHSSALFVQWAPYTLAQGTWELRGPGYAQHLLSICDRFAPGTSDLVVDSLLLHPQAIESHFGMTHGHIHHVDNTFGYDDRMPYDLGIDGLYACSAGCHPGGSVIGAAGYNAANLILAS